MSKKRRTKKQKLLSDVRRKLQALENLNIEPPTYSLPDIKSQSTNRNIGSINVKSITLEKDYSYVPSSIKSTMIIAFIIFLLNIFVYVLVEKHIVSVSWI